MPAELLAGLSVEQRTLSWKRALGGGDGSHTVVAAADDGVVAGFATVGQSRDHDAEPGTGELWALYAHPDAWSQGVGAALVEAAQRELLDLGFDRATLWVLTTNGRARRFYEAGGWQKQEHHQVDAHGGFQLEEVRYELDLIGR